MTQPSRSGVCLIFVLLLAVPQIGRADTPPFPGNIRPRDALAASLVRFGVERSATFRWLVGELDGSNVIVYIEVRRDPARQDGGCLQFIGQGAGTRWVQASVDAGTSSLATAQKNLFSLTATLAHELQHARELSGAPTIRGPEDFDTFFRRIGVPVGPNTVDTEAARALGRVVESELRGFTTHW